MITFITIFSLAELSSRISLNGGSGYNYVYVTVGELAAWIVAVIYIIRFVLVVATLSRSLHHYVVGFLKLCEVKVPEWMVKVEVWGSEDCSILAVVILFLKFTIGQIIFETCRK